MFNSLVGMYCKQRSTTTSVLPEVNQAYMKLISAGGAKGARLIRSKTVISYKDPVMSYKLIPAFYC